MVEHTPDGRYIVVGGRRWRATDPLIPEDRQAELRTNLMAWRREVGRTSGDTQRHARDGVQAGKEALGERGTPWWEQTDAQRRRRWSVSLDSPAATS